MSGVKRTDYAYPSVAACEGPDNWFREERDDATLRRVARGHVKETGHTVHIDWGRSTVYKCEPAPAVVKAGDPE